MADFIDNNLMRFYETLVGHFGPQRWWPGDSPFEVIVGAVLTQNTNWGNVEKAINNLKAADVLDCGKIDKMSHEELAPLIRPAGYFNVKSRRLKHLIHFLQSRYEGCLEVLADQPVDMVREELLSVKGVGRETADSIILYALEKLTFVVDAYTHRILARHLCIAPESDYDEIKEYCEDQLPSDIAVYNECHALFVRLGKEYCKPRPKCDNCPLAQFEHCIDPDQ